MTSLLADSSSGLSVEERVISNIGDRDRTLRLDRPSTPGLFTGDLTRALLDGLIDFAVHSLKDLPITPPDGSVLVALLERVHPCDALIIPGPGGLNTLPPGSRIGTSSARRAAQLLHVRSDLCPVPIRGNVGTRLRKMDDGQFEGLILASAGLNRLGLEGRISELLDSDDFLPAPGQGALAVECRADDEDARAALAPLDDPEVRSTVEAERGFLEGLGGGCSLPIGALAEIKEDGRLYLQVGIWPASGDAPIRLAGSCLPSSGRRLGAELAEEARADGADSLISATETGRYRIP